MLYGYRYRERERVTRRRSGRVRRVQRNVSVNATAVASATGRVVFSSCDHVAVSRVSTDRRPVLLRRAGLGPGQTRRPVVATVSGRRRRRLRPGRGGRMRPVRSAVRQSLGMRQDGNMMTIQCIHNTYILYKYAVESR